MTVPSAQEVETQLVATVAGMLGREASEVDPAAPMHTLGIDSLNLIELLVSIEKSYGKNVLESGLDKVDFASLGKLARSVQAFLEKPCDPTGAAGTDAAT